MSGPGMMGGPGMGGMPGPGMMGGPGMMPGPGMMGPGMDTGGARAYDSPPPPMAICKHGGMHIVVYRWQQPVSVNNMMQQPVEATL
jgi:hypothetical protein